MNTPTSGNSPIRTRFTSANPCPVCDTGTKGCSETDDGLTFCRGTPAEPDRWRKLSEDDQGFGHFRPSDVSRPPPRPTRAAIAPIDWRALAVRFASAFPVDRRAELATALNLPEASLDALPLIGWKADENCWTFPEMNAVEKVIGINRRFPPGQTPPRFDSNKAVIQGGNRGLLLPLKWREGDGPLLIVEGGSDTLSVTHAALNAIGRPNNSGGAEMLAVLLAAWPARRGLIVVGENDRKPAGGWPGREGAEKVARTIAAKLGRPVLVAFPPVGAKDSREWLTHPDRSETPWADRGRELLAHLEATAERIDPAASSDSESKGKPTASVKAKVVCLADVEPEEVRWLWRGRIALGKITLLVGRPKEGKSFLTCFMAATVSTGGRWPLGERAPVGSTLFISAEDDPADTIRPRLDAAGADCKKVHLLQALQVISEKGEVREVAFTLQNVDQIRETLDRLPDCKLVVIDPIGSYLGGGVDAHRDNEVRAVLAPLGQLASERKVAMLIVCHNRKSETTFADDSTLGSRGFVGLARSVLHLRTDPDDAEKKRRVFAAGGTNIAGTVETLAFTITGSPPRLEWEPEPLTGVHADDLMKPPAENKPGRPQAARTEARDLLSRMLASGPAAITDIKTEAKAAGVSWPTVERVKGEMNVTGKPQKGQFEKGKPPVYFWYFGDDWTPPALNAGNIDGGGRKGGAKRPKTPEISQHHQPSGNSDGDGPTPSIFGEADGAGKSQGETTVSPPPKARRHQNSAPLRADPDPITNEAAFEELLQRSGWGWLEALGWLEQQGEYAPSAGYSHLTHRERRLLADKLTEVIAVKRGVR